MVTGTKLQGTAGMEGRCHPALPAPLQSEPSPKTMASARLTSHSLVPTGGPTAGSRKPSSTHLALT